MIKKTYVYFRNRGKVDELTSLAANYHDFFFQIVYILSKILNFTIQLYEPRNALETKWGKKSTEGKYDGLLGEMMTYSADVALGDLQNIKQNMQIMDLTIPYNIECLTFLTPVALTDNSWMTLILPFK